VIVVSALKIAVNDDVNGTRTRVMSGDVVGAVPNIRFSDRQRCAINGVDSRVRNGVERGANGAVVNVAVGEDGRAVRLEKWRAAPKRAAAVVVVGARVDIARVDITEVISAAGSHVLVDGSQTGLVANGGSETNAQHDG
jgi:hypothetical protein